MQSEAALLCCAGELGRSASMPVRRFIVRLPAAAAPAAPATNHGADDSDATVRPPHTPLERASCSGVCWGCCPALPALLLWHSRAVYQRASQGAPALTWRSAASPIGRGL